MHQEQQREVTVKELTPRPLFFLTATCHNIITYAKYEKIP